MSHTPHRLTYQLGEYTGENWPVAQVKGTSQDGDLLEAWIVIDKVRASQVEFGDFEDDLRLWTVAPELLAVLKAIVKDELTDIRVSLLERAIDAIVDVEGES